MAAGERLHALLVGIDGYLPNSLAGGSYPQLRGSVNDVRSMFHFLRRDLGVSEDRISTLTASGDGAEAPPEPRSEWPTYANLVAALEQLRQAARPGDQVLFYFSGHGGRIPTGAPELKGEDGHDECLVPVDIGDPEARYLRDVEVAAVAAAMARRGLFLTMVLDCCHAGGASRDVATAGGPAVRGGRFVDRTPRPEGSLVAPPEELARAWREMSRAGRRDFSPGSGWLPEPKGFVLLAACRATELAREDAFEDASGKVRRQGAFSYWLVDSLRQLGAGTTYKRLHDRLLAKVRSRFETQTPVLEGEGMRVVFDETSERVQHAVNVLEVDRAGDRLLLATGRAHGVVPGATFAVVPPGTEDLGAPQARQALVETTGEIDAAIAWARVVELLKPGVTLKQGAQAVLLDVGAVRLRRAIGWQTEALTPAARADVAAGIRESGFLEPVAGEREPDFRIARRDGEVVILDAGGARLLRLGSDPPPRRIVQRLVHLATYRNVQELDNPDPRSHLRGQLVVELGRLPGGLQRGRRIAGSDVEPLAGGLARAGEWLCLTIRNRGRRRFHCAVLNLQPGWSIKQVVPCSGFEPHLTLEGGAAERFPLRPRLPPGARRSVEILKAFATHDNTDFRWLELPKLGEPPPPAFKSIPSNPLEALLSQVATDAPKTREYRPRPQAASAWTVAQVAVEVVAGEQR